MTTQRDDPSIFEPILKNPVPDHRSFLAQHSRSCATRELSLCGWKGRSETLSEIVCTVTREAVVIQEVAWLETRSTDEVWASACRENHH